MNTIKIVDLAEGTEIEREMNAEELAQRELDQIEFAAQQAAKAELEAKRQALLDKLGITADEAKLLLG